MGDEHLPGGASLLELSDLGTQPLPLGFETRGVRLAGVLPSDESFVEAVARVGERSAALVAGPPTEIWALQKLLCSLMVYSRLPDGSSCQAEAGGRPAAGAVVKVCNISLHGVALAAHGVEWWERSGGTERESSMRSV
jgi:hypothetical protein